MFSFLHIASSSLQFPFFILAVFFLQCSWLCCSLQVTVHPAAFILLVKKVSLVDDASHIYICRFFLAYSENSAI